MSTMTGELPYPLICFPFSGDANSQANWSTDQEVLIPFDTPYPNSMLAHLLAGGDQGTKERNKLIPRLELRN
jgi:hypothetical protein